MAAARGRQTAQQPPRTEQRREHRPSRDDDTRSRVDDVIGDDAQVEVVTVDSVALESITKSEILMQLEAAHRYPRDIDRFLKNSTTLATLTKETAASCIYSIPRMDKGKQVFITGPSIRLAEMSASSWNNLHLGSRIIDTGMRTVTAQGISWDLETNNRISTEIKRGITTSGGKRYSDDMVRVTEQAAISIALRNAIFRTIPKALIDVIYGKASAKATGVIDNTFPNERDKLIGWFKHRKEVPPDLLYARLGVKTIDQIEPEHLEIMIGWANAIKSGEMTVSEIFAPTEEVRAARAAAKPDPVEDMLNQRRAKSQPPPANDAKPSAMAVRAVVDALADADEAWGNLMDSAAVAVVEAWTGEQRERAYRWAVDFAQTPDNQAPPEQPEFTLLERAERQPGED